MTVGDPVLRTGKPLSVELGPGISFSFVDSPFDELRLMVSRVFSWYRFDGKHLRVSQNVVRSGRWASLIIYLPFPIVVSSDL